MRLRPGDKLVLRDEPDNEYDDRAILLDAEHNRPVGWIPIYMLDEFTKRSRAAHPSASSSREPTGQTSPLTCACSAACGCLPAPRLDQLRLTRAGIGSASRDTTL